MRLIKLKSTNPILETEYGIFKAIYELEKFSWLSSDDADILDIDYYLNHSGDKYVTPLFEDLFIADEEHYLTKLAKIIVLKYGDNWNKIYNAYFVSSYNPLENYSMVEDEKVNTDISVTTGSENNVFGFNTESEDGISNNKNSINQTTSGSDEKNTRNLTRSGNIGVTTSQQMLESEIKLRLYDFYQAIMNDIDNVLCLAYRPI